MQRTDVFGGSTCPGDNMVLWSQAADVQSDSEGGSEMERADEINPEGKAEDEDDGNNSGWAEAMGKILGKKTTDPKSSILVKNKELEKIKAKERQEQLERKKQVDQKQAWEMMFREKPDVVTDRETERAFQRIATRGVVQLFNAVRKHQKTVDDKVKEAGGSERKKARILGSVSKRDFIHVLRREEEGVRGTGRTEKDAAAAEKPAWSVLSDDFMMGATMKDWDKNSDQEEPHGGDSGGGSSSAPPSAMQT